MKKINIVLIVIISLLAILTTLGEISKGLAVILKDLSILLTLTAPYIYEKISKKSINEGFKLIWIIFIFMAHYLGVICCLYNQWPGFDKIVHTISGILTAYVAYLILKSIKTKDKKFDLLFIISFSALCAVSWETFEFICNILVGGDAQMVAATGVDDTMLDMIVALIGSFMFAIWDINNSKLKK